MIRVSWLVVVILVAGCWSYAADQPISVSPVLVELFTSEGCSSCPPADELLRELDAQPIKGAQIVVLSEHVDYWNHLGWSDPFSSHLFSLRQNDYARQLGGSDVYTPQMIVDGTREFVGSDGKLAREVIENASTQAKLQVDLSGLALAAPGVLRSRVEVAALPVSSHISAANVYLAIALNHAESKVSGGENGGRRLQHVAVVRRVDKIGSVSARGRFQQETTVRVDRKADPANLRVIVFAQDPKTGRVLGAAMQLLKP